MQARKVVQYGLRCRNGMQERWEQARYDWYRRTIFEAPPTNCKKTTPEYSTVERMRGAEAHINTYVRYQSQGREREMLEQARS